MQNRIHDSSANCIMIITAVRSFCFLLFCFLSYSKFFIRKWTIYFIFFFRKIFLLIGLYFNHDDGKFEKKKKKRNSGLFCGKVIEYFREYDACLYCVLKNTNTLNLHEPYFFFINIYNIYIFILVL